MLTANFIIKPNELVDSLHIRPSAVSPDTAGEAIMEAGEGCGQVKFQCNGHLGNLASWMGYAPDEYWEWSSCIYLVHWKLKDSNRFVDRYNWTYGTVYIGPRIHSDYCKKDACYIMAVHKSRVNNRNRIMKIFANTTIGWYSSETWQEFFSELEL